MDISTKLRLLKDSHARDIAITLKEFFHGWVTWLVEAPGRHYDWTKKLDFVVHAGNSRGLAVSKQEVPNSEHNGFGLDDNFVQKKVLLGKSFLYHLETAKQVARDYGLIINEVREWSEEDKEDLYNAQDRLAANGDSTDTIALSKLFGYPANSHYVSEAFNPHESPFVPRNDHEFRMVRVWITPSGLGDGESYLDHLKKIRRDHLQKRLMEIDAGIAKSRNRLKNLDER